jgi:hydroxyacyl-ACP dehydratase HTD2-like protein with hotdog domain
VKRIAYSERETAELSAATHFACLLEPIDQGDDHSASVESRWDGGGGMDISPRIFGSTRHDFSFGWWGASLRCLAHLECDAALHAIMQRRRSCGTTLAERMR